MLLRDVCISMCVKHKFLKCWRTKDSSKPFICLDHYFVVFGTSVRALIWLSYCQVTNELVRSKELKLSNQNSKQVLSSV